MTSTMNAQDRTEDNVEDDLAAWESEMKVAIAAVNLTSARRALTHGARPPIPRPRPRTTMRFGGSASSIAAARIFRQRHGGCARLTIAEPWAVQP